MKCKQCDREVSGKSQYCSESCKTVYNRNKRNGKPEQSQTGTQPEHNPLALPGEPGYVGVCKLINGEWVVQPDPPVPVEDLSDIDLQLRLRSYPGSSWTTSPEYKEVLRRKRPLQAAGAAL